MIAVDELRADYRALGIAPLRRRMESIRPAIFPIADTFEGEIRSPQSLHKYTYAHDDPVNNSDPTGKFIGALFGGLVGLLIGVGISTFLREQDATSKVGAYGFIMRQLVKTQWVHALSLAGALSGALYEKSQAVPVIHVVRQSGRSNWVLRATSHNLLAELDTAIQLNDPIVKLVFTGHGNPTVAELADSTGLTTAGTAIQIVRNDGGPDTDVTQRFRNALADNAVIKFQGCNITSEEDNLAQEFSRILPGREVWGTAWFDFYAGFDVTLNPYRNVYRNGEPHLPESLSWLATAHDYLMWIALMV